MRKTRSDHRLAKLTPDQRAKLLTWLRANLKYDEVVALVREQIGIETSATAVGNYYATHMADILRPPEPPTATGIEVKITCERRGEIKLAIRPLLPDRPAPADEGDDQQVHLRAAGVEIVVLSQRNDEVKLGVYPVAEQPPESAAPDEVQPRHE